MQDNTVEIEIRGTSVVVKVLSHEVDMYNVPEMRAQMADILDEKPAKVIIDFSQTGHLDSSALGLLFRTKQQIDGYGGKMILTGIRESLEMLIQVTRSDKVFAFASSVEEALAD